MDEPSRILFTFWGRRGALSQFALEAARAARTHKGIAAAFSISRQNESFPDFEELGIPLLPIDTFSSHAGAVLGLWRIPGLRRRLAQYLRQQRIQVLLELMPHVWSPLVMSVLDEIGVRYATIVHDASAHPGDRTAIVKPLLDMPLRMARPVLTLSDQVAGELVSAGRVPASRVRALFHPDLTYTDSIGRQYPAKGEPFRLLFLGRIMPYKGLPLFVDAVEILKEQGFNVLPCVYGEGALGAEERRLGALGAEIVNRWLSGEEVARALAGAHAVVLSHVEASQSGVAAAAFGARLPVVATPIGGLREQVEDGKTGILALAATGSALAEAISRLVLQPDLYRHIVDILTLERQRYSMSSFLDAALEAIFRYE